jgi:hypothetical protein
LTGANIDHNFKWEFGEPMAEEKKLSGPDFADGVSITKFADGGMVQGHANGETILVARRGGKTIAVATIGRDRESLESELALETAVQAG